MKGIEVNLGNKIVKDKKVIDKGFKAMLFIKGFGCFMEAMAGVFLALPISRILRNSLINFLQKELVEYSHDKFLNMLYKVVTGYNMDMNHFMIFYMISHGAAKFLIVYLLYKNKIWAYPLAMVVLGGFAAYQMYKFVHLHSVFLIILTAVDIILIIFIYLEYREQKIARGL